MNRGLSGDAVLLMPRYGVHFVPPRIKPLPPPGIYFLGALAQRLTRNVRTLSIIYPPNPTLMRWTCRGFGLLLLSLCPLLGWGQGLLLPAVDSIPMRDGRVLAADTYRPAGNLARPTLLIQTPYNRLRYRLGLPLGIGLALDSIPYNVVVVDWRGFYGSLGALAPGADRGEDGYDVVEWIAAQPWSDGQVGTWGPSALGQVQFQTAREQPPHLVCICPVVAEPQFAYEEYYPGGVYRTEYIEQLDGLGFGLSGILQANPVYNLLWTFAEQDSWYPGAIEVPTFMIGGWFDHNIEPSLAFFAALQAQSPPAVRAQHQMLVGPWAHGGFGVARPGGVNQGELSFPAAAGWNDSLARAFFDHHLLGAANGWDSRPALTYFRMGADRWASAPAWPPPLPRPRWYLQADGSLAPAAPSSPDSLSWVSDPRDPSPTWGGPTLRQDQLQGPYDQAAVVESRSDLLAFTTPPLSDSLRVEGAIHLRLFAAAGQPDADVAVRLTHVYPDGRSILLLDDIRRLRFRAGFTAADTALAVPGQVYALDYVLPDIAQVFPPGHRLRLLVSGANYPRFALNLQNGGALYGPGDTTATTLTLSLGGAQASYVELPVATAATAVGPVPPPPALHAYPNPCRDWLHLRWEGPPAVRYRVLDPQGRLMATGNWQGRPIPVQAWPAGAYVLELQGRAGAVLARTTVVRRD